jgi:peptidoglycan/LPS O-acetylase OafA/YrhL
LGVEIFFVISGFVIPYSIWKLYPNYSIRLFPKFLARRIVRLEPPYVISLALVIILHYIVSDFSSFRGAAPSYELLRLASHIFYLVPLTNYEWIQPTYWSLAYEFAFYVSIGLTYRLVSCMHSAVVRFATFTFLVSMILLGQLPSRVLLFVMGVSLFRNIAGFQNPLIGVSVVAICGFVIGCTAGPAIALTGLASIMILYWGMRFEFRGIAGKALLSCGAISYSLYLVHVPIGGRVVNLGRRLVDGPVQEFLLSIFALVIAVCFAAVFYTIVEKPFVRRARRLSLSRAAAQSAIS